MNDDKKCLEQAEDIDNIREIAQLEKLAEETEEKFLEIKRQIRKLKNKDKHKYWNCFCCFRVHMNRAFIFMDGLGITCLWNTKYKYETHK